MFCPNCGNDLPGTPKKCPVCGANLAKDIKEFKKQTKKPGLLKPILSLIISCVLLASSLFGAIFSTSAVYEKASDKTTEGKVEMTASDEKQYDTGKIAKPDGDNPIFTGLVKNEEEADEAREEIEVIENAIEEAEAEVEAENPTVTDDTLYEFISAVRSIASELYYEDLIADYSSGENTVAFELNAGGYYIYMPHIEGYDSGSAPELSIATYQPYYSAGQYESLPDSKKKADDGAKKIADTFSAYTFTDGTNYDDSEVTPEVCADFGANNIVLWHGHGGYNSQLGPIMCLTMERTRDTDAKYSELLEGGYLYYTSDSYAIGADFIEHCVPDGAFDNSIFYLGVCEGGYTSDLANAFLNKGAEAVYAPDDTVYTKYNANMIYSISEGLTKTHDDGSYYTVTEALDYAKEKHGDTDGSEHDAEIRLFSNDASFSLDWYEDYVISDRDVVLVLDISGSMGGTPLEETKEAACSFVDTVLEENVRVGVVAYADSAVMVSGFSTRKQSLKSQINALYTLGGTNMDAGLTMAEEMLDESSAKKKIVVVMSDGVPNNGRQGTELIDYADSLKKKEFYIYTLGFFTSLYDSEKATAQDLMDKIATEGYHYEVTDASDLVYFFGDMADVISGQKYIYIEIACPVKVRVTKGGETLDSSDNSLSTRTSFGTLAFEELEGDAQNKDPKKILRLKDGMEYDIEITGTGFGTMDYTIQYMDENGDYADKREFNSIQITNTTRIDTVAASERKETALNVDTDGDGEYDEIYTAGKNGVGQIHDNTWQKVFMISAIVSGALVLLSILFLVYIIIRRKKFDKKAMA